MYEVLNSGRATQLSSVVEVLHHALSALEAHTKADTGQREFHQARLRDLLTSLDPNVGCHIGNHSPRAPAIEELLLSTKHIGRIALQYNPDEWTESMYEKAYRRAMRIVSILERFK